jgi:alanine racemase
VKPNPTAETQRAWVDVDLDALLRNGRAYHDKVGVPLIPMVKADGYGLGALAVARTLVGLEPWGFGVATVDEARALRIGGIDSPLVVFTSLSPALVDPHREATARPTIGDLEALRAWLSASDAPFHLEIDTGMHRSGLRWNDASILAEAGNLLVEAAGWEGAFTHFHSAGSDPVATQGQWERLQQAIAALGRRPPLLHAANSAGGGYGRSHAGDLARPGIHLYGGAVGGLDPEVVAALRARVTAVRPVEAGESVSYEASWRAAAPTTVATLGIGYADGVLRSLSNRGEVELLGRRCPIVGRVTMDQLMVDAGDLPVRVGEVATVFGGLVSLDEQAAMAGTISYELLTSLGGRLPRRYHRNP